ncbi:hypothetical protein FQR65_LT20410 [Abscondita terminalis]|nr:hypothetical protein FQR65_LT20410 [Abscondita terminalis]
MEYNDKNDKATAQGRDTPVPVGGVSVGAGSARPSSRDCGSKSVEIQADKDIFVTGRNNEDYSEELEETRGNTYSWDTAIDPFERRQSLSRTPTKSKEEGIQRDNATGKVAGNQALSLDIAFGTETGTESTSRGSTPYIWDDLLIPLSRSNSIDLSSTTASKANEDRTPKSISYHNYAWNYEEGTSVKRKRIESATPDESWKQELTATANLSNKYRKTTERIDNEIKNLYKLTRENINTKREIKDAVAKLRSLSTSINTYDMQNLLQTLGRQQETSEQEPIITNLTPWKNADWKKSRSLNGTMEYNDKNDKATAQGRDTPVPVGGVSVGAGSARPSSRDCGSKSVEIQADKDIFVTGRNNEDYSEELEETKGNTYSWDTAIDPFERRQSLSRTPTKSKEEGKQMDNATGKVAGNQALSLDIVFGTETGTESTSRGSTPYIWDDLLIPLSRSNSIDLSPTTASKANEDRTPNGTMEYNDKNDKATAQGRDTPVPVGGVSVGAGSARPSSRDCGSKSVEIQADKDIFVTGRNNEDYSEELEETRGNTYSWDTAIDPFERRQSLSRTPTKSKEEGIQRDNATGKVAGNQALSLDIAFGTETGTESTSRGSTPYIWDDLLIPLSRSNSIDLSSTTASKANEDRTPKSISYHNYAWNYEEGTSVKRKRIESATPDESWKQELTATANLSNKYRKTTERIDNEIKNLYKLTRENINTKREIKDAVAKLRSLSTSINTYDMQNLLQTLGRQQETSEQEPIITNLTVELQASKDKEDDLIKALEECRLEKEQITNELHKMRADAEKLKKLLSMTNEKDIPVDMNDIQKTNNFEEYKNLVDREWLEGAFQVTTMAEGSPQKSPINHDLAVWLHHNNENSLSNIEEEMLELFPALNEMEEDVGFYTITTTMSKLGARVQKNRHIFKLKCENEEEEFFNSLKHITEMRLNEEMMNPLTLYIPGSMKPEPFRRLVECACRESKTPINILYVRPRKITPTTKRRVKNSYALVVGTTDKSYTDVLKQVKTAIEHTDANQAILGMRSTKNGDLLIVTQKDDEAIKKLNQAIRIRDLTTTVKNMPSREPPRPKLLRQ